MDFENIPFAEWLEQAIPAMVSINASKIAIVALDDEGTSFTAYYNSDVSDMAIFADAIQSDEWLKRLEANRERIKAMLEDER